MTQIEAGFTYKVEEYGVVSMDVSDLAHAEDEVLDYVRNTYEDATDITVDYVKELKI